MKNNSKYLKYSIPFFMSLLIPIIYSSKDGSSLVGQQQQQQQERVVQQDNVNFYLQNTTWHNELGSVMTITEAHDNQLRGFYESAVGNVNVREKYPLSGMYNNNGKNTTLAWSVSWNSERTKSSTAWCGQLRDNGQEIESSWLLRLGSESEWNSTLTNKDRFVKIKKSI